MELKFEWHYNKAKENERNHRVSFEEARTVFYDDLSISIDDPNHSTYEQRYIIVGMSERQRILLVSYTERGNAIRIISARLATAHDRESYEEGV